MQLQKKLESMQKMQESNEPDLENLEIGVGQQEITSQMSSLNQGILDE
jgi:hypothetical protein